ncbi:MAG: ABC transporter ATP-binding protein [Bacilli bacterium]
MKKILEIKNVSMNYFGEIILNNINLDIYENEFVTLLGPSGCGKTTLLNIIGGFVKHKSGNVKLYDRVIDNLNPYDREVNTVFQNYALFPHLNVYDNIAFGLKNKNVSKKDIKNEVDSVLKLVKLSGYEKRNIKELSGGQKQRVAIARAVINKPDVLLLDEPLSALDLKLRQDMQYELKDLQKSLGITFVFVTHDQEEALTMSDKIVVMNNGEIQQIGTPEEVYNEPKNKFVASFIGENNIINSSVIGLNTVSIFGKKFEIDVAKLKKGANIKLVIRPEDIYIVNKEHGFLCGIVDDITFKGVHYEIIVLVEEFEFVIHALKQVIVGSEVGLIFHQEDVHIMDDSYDNV